MSINHYENFPVASWLCPPALRPAVMAIYHFARTADDIADEGDANAAARLADLRAYRADLVAGAEAGSSLRWPSVFGPLHAAIARHGLPTGLFTDLLSAFEQDLEKHRYAERTELLDYCARSANPVGRLLLLLYGIRGADELVQSDAICSALQLVNFWQDLGVDTRRGRLYVPLADVRRHGLSPEALLRGEDGPAARTLVVEMARWARELMLRGAPLVHRIAGRAGWELRLVVQGGLRIIDRIEALPASTLHRRPTLRPLDAPRLAWRALLMRAPADVIARKPA